MRKKSTAKKIVETEYNKKTKPELNIPVDVKRRKKDTLDLIRTKPGLPFLNVKWGLYG